MVALGCSTPPPASRPSSPAPRARTDASLLGSVDTAAIRSVARVLADDALLGRKTGTKGAELAAEYLAGECRIMGLRSVSSDDYFQRIPFVEATVDQEVTQVQVTGPGVDTTFFHHEEFIADVATLETMQGFEGELAYVGRAPDILFRRSDLPPLEGRVALMRGEFGASGAAADTLRARGAVGVIQVVDDARRYRLFRQTRGPTRLMVDDLGFVSSFIPRIPTILAGPRMTVTLYQGLTGEKHGSWNDAYLNGLAAGLPAPTVLEGWRAAVRVRVSAESQSSRNVACFLPGSGPQADSAIVLVAHYDHLGVGIADQRGDSIYNGFSDNATGVAMAMAIAKWFRDDRAAGRGLRHSLLLLFPTGEEQGLLGSDWFLAQPLWPLERLVAVVNLDGNAPAGRPVAWRVAGDDEGALVHLVVEEATRQGWSTTLAPPAPGSDYYPFLRRGIPAVFFVPSDGRYEGMSLTMSDQLRTGMWSRYHQPDDEYREDFSFEGLERYASFARDVIRRIDGGGLGEKGRVAARP